jgi:benzoyl-CoA reductase/2-hydroxyglutaryl-CoA dehydratase subunit BcrC/BadD/HgdB
MIRFQNLTNENLYNRALEFLKEWKKKPYSLTFTQISELSILSKAIGHPLTDKSCGVCIKRSCEVLEAYAKAYDMNMNDYNQLKPNDLLKVIQDKHVLLLGTDHKIKPHIFRKKFDIVIGLNNIYQNKKIYKYVNLHFFDEVDDNFIIFFDDIADNKNVIYKNYDENNKSIYNHPNVFFVNTNDMSSNWLINLILELNPEMLEIAGVDIDEETINYLINQHSENFNYN